jgi:spoIIIJ-associated protein
VEDGAEFSGKTVDDAIAEAERTLGAGRDELAIEVITQGSRGVFGIGAESARIRAHRKSGVAPPSPPSVSPVSPADSDELEPATARTATAVATPTPDGAAIAGEAQSVLEDLLHAMRIDADVSVRDTDNPIMLVITGRNLGVLIGRRGDNLAALQFMVNLILSKNRRQWPRVVIDVENYRAKREEALRGLADRIAFRVRRNGRPFTLEAMPASDRRIIHLALRDRSDIETYSIGEGPARRVVVAPKRS